MENKKFKSFKVQAARGDIYDVTIKFVTAVPEDRYGWEKDHLAIWLAFEPTVGSTLETGISLPIKEYSSDELLSAVMNEAEKTVNRLLVKYDQDKIARAAEEKHKAELDVYAEHTSGLLEAN